jgi:putative heme-binding domain-containing protein
MRTRREFRRGIVCLCSCWLFCCLLGNVPAADDVVHMLVPGFAVRELPVKLSNINNLRFAPDGTLTTLGYDGRVHLLRDTNDDGLEDEAIAFWDKPTITIPVGMCWGPEGLFVSSRGKVSLLLDKDGDRKADVEEIIASGWPETDVAAGGVDATAVVRDAEGNLYFGLMTADYSNPYRIGDDGKPRYDTNSIRGTIQKWSAKSKKIETIATGIRVPYTLEFNQTGDLFVTDQEGETWCPDGNPLDELNHIVMGKNYGFPPRHPQYLPNLISEPPVVSFGPQHQSTCGFVFNDPGSQKGLFGPKAWNGDAIVTGESRGKLWRVKMIKTAAGYVGEQFPIARLSMLTTDVAIGPEGDLYVSCHSGAPDWGTGPNGAGKLFKITYTNSAAPQVVAVWPWQPMELRVAFDRPVDFAITNALVGSHIEVGHFVSAGDRFEVLKPSYNVVKQQSATPRGNLRITSAQLSGDQRTLVLGTTPHPQSVTYSLTLPNVKEAGAAREGSTLDLEYRLNGVMAGWLSANKVRGTGIWLPHVDLGINHEFTGDSKDHQSFFHAIEEQGLLELQSTLQLLRGTNVLSFEANAPFKVRVGDTRQTAVKQGDIFLAKVTATMEEEGLPLQVALHTGVAAKPFFRVSYSTSDDPTPRPLPFGMFLQPWAPKPNPPAELLEETTDLAGGDHQRGRDLFFSDKLKCAECHRVRGEGKTIGPDLSNLRHRDASSVLRDIKQPNATLNPDYVAFDASLKNDDVVTGFVRGRNQGSLTLMQVDGKEIVVAEKELKHLRASDLSLMPEGLLDGLSEGEIRDLLVYLTTDAKN